MENEDKRCTYEKCEQCPLIKHCETCYKELCLFENCNHYCKACPVTCHSKPDPIFEETNLEKFRIKAKAETNFEIAYFPTIRKNDILRNFSWEIVGVKFEEIYNFKSGLMRALDLHDFFCLNQKVKILVTFNVPDKILEKLWLTFQKKSFRLVIKGLKADYICSPNFSNFFDTPRYQYWRNIWRSVVMTNELCELNHNVIFDVSSPLSATHQFYSELITKSNTKSLIFNCQAARIDRYKKRTLERLLYFFDSTPKNIPFIINGFSSKKYIQRIYSGSKGRKLYFTSSTPFIRAICKQQLESAKYSAEEPGKLFLEYVEKLNNQNLELRRKYANKKSE